MPSLIPGFEYDIFISYRQKDNKHDGWVTEFVNNLKGELESTFKEEISVYFDENQHDGLLETHDVDASLKEKLKCLIFIPIISRTYCDPKSFAWEHEFKAFVEMASKDQFGLKIRLPNGNIASRVLPVLIYDPDPEDACQVEAVLGTHLRGIDFVYKEPGVNRPLTPKDQEDRNDCKTNYRNQINKTANALREITSGLKNRKNKPDRIHLSTDDIKPKKIKIHKSIIIACLVFLALVITGIFTIPKYIKPLEKIETSIAVMPFTNDSPSDSTIYYIIGIEDAIRNDLQSIKSFTRVLPRTSTEHFRKAAVPSFIEISRELKVNYIVEGSALKFGKKFKLNVKLIRVVRESLLWSKSFEQEINGTTDIFRIESEIAQTIAKQLEAAISPFEMQLLKKTSTENMEALDAYLKGEYYRNNLSKGNMEIAKKYYDIALEKDPGFAAVYCSIAMLNAASAFLGYISPSEGAAKQYEAITAAYRLDSTMAEVHLGFAAHYILEWNWKECESEFLKSFRINPNVAMSHARYSDILMRTGKSKEAIEQMELALKLDPLDQGVKVLYCYALLLLHRYADAINIGREVLKIDPENVKVLGSLAQALYLSGNQDEALKLWKTLYSRMYPDFVHAFDKGERSDYSAALELEADTLAAQSINAKVTTGDIAMLYAASGNKNKALNYWERAYKEHDINMMFLTDPVNDFLRDDPRYQYLCRKMELPIN